MLSSRGGTTDNMIMRLSSQYHAQINIDAETPILYCTGVLQKTRRIVYDALRLELFCYQAIKNKIHSNLLQCELIRQRMVSCSR